jgi:DNA-binding response OmpR family regulator
VNRILIAAPSELPSLLDQSLRAAGYITKVVKDRFGVIDAVRDDGFDLFILDLEEPADGWESTLRELRALDPSVPVMLLSPRVEAGDEISALEREADERLTKPFGIEEVLLRVRGGLRERSPRGRRFLRAGELAVDLDSRRVEVQGRPVELSKRELRLLEALIRRPGEVVSREQLLAAAWGYDYDPGSNVVAVYVGYLRRKLGAEAVETVRGAGYRLRA